MSDEDQAVSVRDASKELWARARAQGERERKRAGEVFNEAITLWLAITEPDQREALDNLLRAWFDRHQMVEVDLCYPSPDVALEDLRIRFLGQLGMYARSANRAAEPA